MNKYYIEYVKDEYPRLLTVKRKDVRRICKNIISEGGEIIKVSYVKLTSYGIEEVEINYLYL